MKPLTVEQQDAYIKNGYARCPWCHSSEIEGGSADFEGKTVTQRVSCNDCNGEWDDIYVLTFMEAH